MTTRVDLIIRQGETWSLSYTKKDSAGSAVDLSGYTARASIRDGYGGGLEAYLSTGTDADGGTITLGGAAGTVVLAMTAAQTSDLAGGLNSATLALLGDPVAQEVSSVSYRYDLELVSAAGAVTRELEGRVQILMQVTT